MWYKQSVQGAMQHTPGHPVGKVLKFWAIQWQPAAAAAAAAQMFAPYPLAVLLSAASCHAPAGRSCSPVAHQQSAASSSSGVEFAIETAMVILFV
jgi:hypothetical protein